MWEWSRRKPLGGSHQSTDERLFPANSSLVHVRRSNDTIGLSLPFPDPDEGSRPGPKLPFIFPRKTPLGLCVNAPRMLNVRLITLDQFRGDSLSCAGHPVVRTPNLDRLAAGGVRLARHYSQSAPCSPGRASLYTGLYQMNHRVVANGTPLDRRFDNIAKAARRAGYAPALFGYTDQSIDPRDARGASDERLSNYDGVLPGFDEVCRCDLIPPTAKPCCLPTLHPHLPMTTSPRR
jgi:hypothetical protein